MKHNRVFTCFFSLLLVGHASQAVSQPVCAVAGFRPLPFGTYNPLESRPRDSQTSLTLQCTGTGTGSLNVRVTSGVSGHPVFRELRSAMSTMRYRVYQDAARTVLWGDNSSRGNSLVLPVSAGNYSLTLYGRIPGRQDVSVGSYSDQLIVQFDF